MGNCSSQSSVDVIDSKRHHIRLLIIGLDNAGKTSIVFYLQKIFATEIIPTVGFSSINLKKYRGFDVEAYDLGGGSKIRGIWSNYFALIHGIIFVIDSGDIERLNEVRNCFHDTLSHKKISGKPVLILINKQDLDTSMDEIDICRRIGVNSIINKYQCPTKVEACSVLNKWGSKVKSNKIVDRGFHWLLDYVIKNWSELESRVKRESREQINIEQQIMRDRAAKFRPTNGEADTVVDSNTDERKSILISRTRQRTLSSHENLGSIAEDENEDNEPESEEQPSQVYTVTNEDGSTAIFVESETKKAVSFKEELIDVGGDRLIKSADSTGLRILNRLNKISPFADGILLRRTSN